MSSLNKVMLIGRLGRDPELRHTQSGTAVCNFSIATDESYNDASGNRQERTEWHKINVWGKLADLCSKYLHKGSLVFIEGSLGTRKWQDNQGQDRYATEVTAQRVQFLDTKSGASGTQQRPSGKQEPQEDYGPEFPSEPVTQGLDQVPF